MVPSLLLVFAAAAAARRPPGSVAGRSFCSAAEVPVKVPRLCGRGNGSGAMGRAGSRAHRDAATGKARRHGGRDLSSTGGP